MMLFFDLEFFVPPHLRKGENYSIPPPDGIASSITIRPGLIFNPAKKDHIILGGHFIRADLTANPEKPIISEDKGLWLWHYNSERELLNAIYNLFLREWGDLYSKKTITISNKKIRDIITVGFAIGRVDLPALFIRARRHNIDLPERLYTIFLKTKVIDLGNVCTFLFPEDPYLYPKSANEVLERLFRPGRREAKSAGKNVWKAYDSQDFEYIENRCSNEVNNIIEIYLKCSNIIGGKDTLR